MRRIGAKKPKDLDIIYLYMVVETMERYIVILSEREYIIEFCAYSEMS
jgi:hypothetical protein